jgi:hypothetical protein
MSDDEPKLFRSTPTKEEIEKLFGESDDGSPSPELTAFMEVEYPIDRKEGVVRVEMPRVKYVCRHHGDLPGDGLCEQCLQEQLKWLRENRPDILAKYSKEKIRSEFYGVVTVTLENGE